MKHNQLKHYLAKTPILQAVDNPPFVLYPTFIPVISVHINKPKLKLKVGQAAELSASVLPVNATNQVVNWVNHNPDVADIELSNGKVIVKGKQSGHAIIIVITEDGKFRDLCTVHVYNYLTTNK
ncbi:Ig domain-containing protein [Microbacteriaceae bacterium 4G12]